MATTNNSEEDQEEDSNRPPPFQRDEHGQEWFVYRQGMQHTDIPRGITHVLVEEGVTHIEDDAFNNDPYWRNGEFDSLQQIRLATSVLRIGPRAFYFCTHLKRVEIPNHGRLKKIGAYAFAQCHSLANDVLLPARVSAVGIQAFGFCQQLTRVDLSQCSLLTQVSDRTFQRCGSLKTILFPPNLERIGTQAFNECSELTFGKEKTTTFPTTLRYISPSAFARCLRLEKLQLPPSIIDIGSFAFAGCTALAVIEFESVSTIQVARRHSPFLVNMAHSPFLGCNGLHTIKCPHTEMPLSLWPRLMVHLFGESGLLQTRDDSLQANRSTCLFSFLCGNY